MVRRTREANAEFVISELRRIGVDVHLQSRLMRMYSVLKRGDSLIAPNDPNFEIALEAERDMQLLGFVFDQSKAFDESGEFRSLIKDSLDDSALPQDDRSQTKGRNAQFQLFVAAVCQSAGLCPVAFEEPDITCHVDGTKLGIAAKRIKNKAKLERRVSDAAKQIQKSRLPGIIAIDICVAMNRENKRVLSPTLDCVFGASYRIRLEEFVRDRRDALVQRIAYREVCGILFHDHQVRYAPLGGWGLDSITYWFSEQLQEFTRNHEFYERYRRGLPNLTFL